MNEKLEKYKSEYEKTLEKIKKLEALAKQQKSKAKAELRKADTHRKIQHGGLVEMVIGKSFDKGILVGLLLEYSDLFKAENQDDYLEIKRKGDQFIAERENKK